jgi:hypothetical protein
MVKKRNSAHDRQQVVVQIDIVDHLSISDQ